MALLLDENLSPHLVALLQDAFPGVQHVSTLGLARASDSMIWAHAREQRLVIVSKHSDFHQRSLVSVDPPKVIWIRRGNCATHEVAGVLRCAQHHRDIPRSESRDAAHSGLTKPASLCARPAQWRHSWRVTWLVKRLTQSGEHHARSGLRGALTQTGLQRDSTRRSRAYLGHTSSRSAAANPLCADLAGLPPMRLLVGRNELLKDDTMRFSEQACRAGVEVHVEVWEGLLHGWYLFAKEMADAEAAYGRGELVRQLSLVQD